MMRSQLVTAVVQLNARITTNAAMRTRRSRKASATVVASTSHAPIEISTCAPARALSDGKFAKSSGGTHGRIAWPVKLTKRYTGSPAPWRYVAESGNAPTAAVPAIARMRTNTYTTPRPR